jgi:hypothetical protein
MAAGESQSPHRGKRRSNGIDVGSGTDFVGASQSPHRGKRRSNRHSLGEVPERHLAVSIPSSRKTAIKLQTMRPKSETPRRLNPLIEENGDQTGPARHRARVEAASQSPHRGKRRSNTPLHAIRREWRRLNPLIEENGDQTRGEGDEKVVGVRLNPLIEENGDQTRCRSSPSPSSGRSQSPHRGKRRSNSQSGNACNAAWLEPRLRRSRVDHGRPPGAKRATPWKRLEKSQKFAREDLLRIATLKSDIPFNRTSPSFACNFHRIARKRQLRQPLSAPGPARKAL